MSLTKERLEAFAKPRVEWFELPELGKFGLKSVSQVQDAFRKAGWYDPAGNFREAEYAKYPIYQLIDQVIGEDGQLLFTDDDFDWLSELAADKLEPLHQLLAEFNGMMEKKTAGTGSQTSAESSSETPD